MYDRLYISDYNAAFDYDGTVVPDRSTSGEEISSFTF